MQDEGVSSWCHLLSPPLKYERPHYEDNGLTGPFMVLPDLCKGDPPGWATRMDFAEWFYRLALPASSLKGNPATGSWVDRSISALYLSG